MFSFGNLSKDKAVDALLSDIPFYVVGVLALAIVTFFVVMNRINQSTVMVSMSAFFAFVAGIIDLTRLLDQTHSTSLASAVAREMLLSASITLQFLFFWHFVSLAPRGEPPRALKSFSSDGEYLHSGSWEQWGIVGIILKYFMLTSVVAVGVLEAISRVAWAFQLNDTLWAFYPASATLQIAVSGIFVLKLAGNILLCSLLPRWRVMVDYLPVIAALAIGAGVAGVNIMSYRFSELPLGRLLQALELYVLLLYLLITAFHKAPIRESFIQDAHDEMVTFDRIEVPSFRNIRIPTPPEIPRRPRRPALSVVRGSETGGSAERFASWISRRISGRPDLSDAKPWAQMDQEERGQIPIMSSSKDDNEGGVERENGRRVWSPEELQEKEQVVEWQAPTHNNPPTTASSDDVTSHVHLPIFPLQTSARQVLGGPPRPFNNRASVLSQVAREGSDSPIYGLNGLIRALSPMHDELSRTTDNSTDSPRTTYIVPEESTPSPTSPTPSSSLNRQKADLERSVAALRLLDPSLKTRRSTIVSAATGGSSPFSLSEFPAPPALESAVHLSTGDEDNNGDDNSDRLVEEIFGFDPPRPSNAAFEGHARQGSFPSTTRGSGTSTLGANASGLQPIDPSRWQGREITSFMAGIMSGSNERGASFDRLSTLDPPYYRRPPSGITDAVRTSRTDTIDSMESATNATIQGVTRTSSMSRARVISPPSNDVTLQRSVGRNGQGMVVTLPASPLPPITTVASRAITVQKGRVQ